MSDVCRLYIRMDITVGFIPTLASHVTRRKILPQALHLQLAFVAYPISHAHGKH